MVDMDDLKRRMEGAVEAVAKELQGLRAGRASTDLLDHVRVDAYGAMSPMNQVANVSAPEARLLTVNVWDASLTKAVEKAIAEAGLGLNPQAEGSLIRVPIPELSEERRKEMGKIAGKYAENGRIAVRNVRRDGMDDAKKAEKAGDISEDEMHGQSDQIQKLTDDFVKQIDEMAAKKEEEIMHV